MSDLGSDLGLDLGLDLIFTNGFGGPIVQGTLIDYLLLWGEPTYLNLPGEKYPLKWFISRLDGGNVDLPSAGAITITDLQTGLAVGSPLTPVVQDTGAVPMQIVGQLWSPPGAGIYSALLLVALGDQIREHRQVLIIR